MREEINVHPQQAAEHLMTRGMCEVDARAAARREFDNVAVLQEQGRVRATLTA